MPFYEYECSNCGHHLEELQTMSEKPLTKCPECGKNTLKKLIGSGAGLIFKGSGFYLTDYKNKNTKSADKSTAEKSKQKSKESTDTKPAAAPKEDITKTSSKKKESK